MTSVNQFWRRSKIAGCQSRLYARRAGIRRQFQHSNEIEGNSDTFGGGQLVDSQSDLIGVNNGGKGQTDDALFELLALARRSRRSSKASMT